MSPAVNMDNFLTPCLPKYSLIISVIRKTTGQSNTPAENCSAPSCPNRLMLNLGIPKVSSKANIFTPINSATSALAIKNPPRIKNKVVPLFISFK